MGQRKPFTLPRSERRQAFNLLPLADCMLQLLIFFMVASGMSMYALLPLRPGAGAGNAAPGTVPEAAPSPAELIAGRVIWTVDVGAVLANGQRLGMDMLPDLARATAAQPGIEVLLLTTPGASVQDLVRVLEALGAAGIDNVVIAIRGA